MLCRTSAMRHVRVHPSNHSLAQTIGMNPSALYIYYFTEDPFSTTISHYFVQVDEDDSSILWQNRHKTFYSLMLLDAT